MDGDLRSQEFGVILASHLALEVLGCKVELVALGCLVAQCLGLLVKKLECVVFGHLLSLGSLYVVPRPLPELTPRYLGGSSILHEVVDGHAANTSYPSFHVAQTNIKVLANAVFSDFAWYIHIKQIVGSDVHVFAAHMHLVGCGHVRVENIAGDSSERWMGDPSAIMTGAYLTKLVCANLCHGGVIGLLVILDRNLRGHSTHRVHSSLVAGLDQQLHIRVHEGASHGDGVAVGQDEIGVLSETFDGAEDVVPATAVETCRVVTELVDDLDDVSNDLRAECVLAIPHPFRKQL
jgi:hypothetical protein